MKKIRIHPEMRHQIAKELNVSLQTVDLGLKYVYKSTLQKSIRRRAKELLQEEADRIPFEPIEENTNNSNHITN